MNKIADLRKIIIQYIAGGNINPDNEREVEKFDDLLRELNLRST